jgi:hypothetical protein
VTGAEEHRVPSPRGPRLAFLATLAVASIGLIALFVALVIWPLWVEYRMEPARQVIPDRVSFGVLRTGAIAEASVRVFVRAVEPAGIRARVRAPWFVKVEDVHVGGPGEGTSRGTVFCDVYFRLDTERPGERAGILRVMLAGERGEIPIVASVAPRDPALPRVLAAETPFHHVATDDASIFDPLLDVVKSSKADVSYARRLPDDLSGFDVVLLAGEALLGTDDRGIAAIRRFVAGGGRLIVAANYFFRGTVERANAILKPHGIVIEDAEPDREVEAGTAADPLTEGVDKLSFFRPSPMKITDPSAAKILVPAPREAEGFVAVWRGKGEVVALGQSLWWQWVGAAPGNGRLIRNLFEGRKRE